LTTKKQEKRAAIFDFDGTLVESHPRRNVAHAQVSEALLKYLSNQGYKVNQESMLELISKLEKEMNERHIYDRDVWWKEAVTQYFGKEIELSESTLTELTVIYWQTVSEESKLFPGVKELLDSLWGKGIKLGLMSDTDGLEGMKAQRIEDAGLVKLFNAIIIPGEDTPETKPSTQPFIKICELLRVSPKNCVHIGDNPKVDISGAKELGMKTIILIPDKAHFQEKTLIPDYLIELKDIKKLEELIPKLLEEER
jgi:putative hydrolase of the HAD superfamily